MPVILENNEQSTAEMSRNLSNSIRNSRGPFELLDKSTGESLALSASVLNSLIKLLKLRENEPTVELTHDQAADFLNVSREYLAKLQSQGVLPGFTLDDLLTYKKARFAKQSRGMAELTSLSEELGLYDLQVQ